MQYRDVLNLTLQSRGGVFRYITPSLLIAGRITDLHTHVIFAKPDPAQPGFAHIPRDSLNIQLVTTAPFEVKRHGGAVTLPIGTRLTLTNLEDIRIEGTGQIGHAGKLQLLTSDPIQWTGAQLHVRPLPQPFALSLQSTSGSQTQISITLSDAQAAVTAGRFSLPNPAQALAASTFRIDHARYRARVRSLRMDSLAAILSPTETVLRVRRLSTAVEGVGRTPGGRSITSRGTFTSDLVVGTASADAPIALFDAPQIHNAQLRPRTPSPGAHMLGAQGSAFRLTERQDSMMADLGLVAPSEQQRNALVQARASLEAMTSPNALITIPYRQIRPFLGPAIERRYPVDMVGDTVGTQLMLLRLQAQNVPNLPSGTQMLISVVPTIQEDTLAVFTIAAAVIDLTSINVPGPADPTLWGTALAHGADQSPVMQDVGFYARALPRTFTKTIDLNNDWTDDSGAVAHLRSRKAAARTTVQHVALLLDTDGLHLLAMLQMNWSQVNP